jgi:hypothetical protein
LVQFFKNQTNRNRFRFPTYRTTRTIVPSVIFLSLSHVKNFIAESRPQKSRAVRKPALRDGRREDVTGVKKSSRSSSSETKETKTAAQLLTARHTKSSGTKYISSSAAATLCRSDAVCLLCAIGRAVSPIHRLIKLFSFIHS